MTKKVALVTYYGDNYGGCLQAYALQQTLINGGFEVKILPVQTSLCDKYTKSHKYLRYIKVVLHPFNYLSRRSYVKKHISQDFLYRQKAFRIFRDTYLMFDENVFVDENQLDGVPIQSYEACVCGSDQIWNPILYDVHPVWTLNFVPKEIKKIAYAPSLGISDIPEEYHQRFKANLTDFYYMSVREKDGAASLSKVLGSNVDVVLDPTLLLYPEQWRVMMQPVEGVTGKYIFCYLFGNYNYIQVTKQRVRELTGLRIISLPYNLRELKSDDTLLYDITPNQFVWLIANATYVVTDSFHASVFSIKMNVPFISLKRSSNKDKKNMNSRLYTLLKHANLEDRLLSEDEIERIEALLSTSIDFDKSNELLKSAIERDKAKLYNAINK